MLEPLLFKFLPCKLAYSGSTEYVSTEWIVEYVLVDMLHLYHVEMLSMGTEWKC